MKITITEAFSLDGEMVNEGDIKDVPTYLAEHLIEVGRAKPHSKEKPHHETDSKIAA